MNKQEFKLRLLNEDKAQLRVDFIRLINSRVDTDAEAFLEELINEDLVREFGPTFIGLGEGVGDHNYPFLLAKEYLSEYLLGDPSKGDKYLVIDRGTALFYSPDPTRRLFNYDPERLQFASSGPIELEKGLEEIFDIQVLPPGQLKGLEESIIHGVKFKIFSKTRLLFYTFAPEERFYKTVCNYVKMDPDFDPESIKQLGSELGQMKEAETILGCLNSLLVPLDRTADSPKIPVETLFEQPVDVFNKELYPFIRAFYAQLPQVYDLNEVRKLGISLGKRDDSDKLFHMLQSIRESRNIF